MAYRFEFLQTAQRQLDQLDRPVAQRIIKKLLWLEQQPNPLLFAMPLHHSAIGDIRFRIGDYRVIAVVPKKHKRIVIAEIGHRREIYR